MDTDLLLAFRQVAAEGSLTAAARTLGYTQSAVSRQIAALEASVGARLFDRRARGVQLTEHGRRLAPHAQTVLDTLATARRELDDVDGLEIGRVRIGAFPTANAMLIPRAIAAFAALHEGVSLKLTEGTSGRQLAHLQAGEVDLAVISAFPSQRVKQRGIRLVHLLDDVMLVAVPIGHRLARRRSVRLADLADESWIAGDPGEDDRLLSPVHLDPSSQPRIDFLVREWTAKLGLVAAGLGITLVPSLAADGARGDVALVPLRRSDGAVRGVFAATSETRPRSPALEGFLTVLAAVAGESPFKGG